MSDEVKKKIERLKKIRENLLAEVKRIERQIRELEGRP
jgi:prefoldin subunit 5